MDTLRLALKYQSIHPAFLYFLCAALWSINERMAGASGLELDLLDRSPLLDFYQIHDRGGVDDQPEPVAVPYYPTLTS